MKIPLGDFGQSIPRVTSGAVSVEGMDAAARAMNNLANTGMQISSQLMAEDNAINEQRRREEQALSRAKAGNALLDHEIQVKTFATDLETRLADGSLSHDKAEEAYQSGLQLLDVPKIDGMDPVTAENFTKGRKRNEFIGLAGIQGAAQKARKSELRGQVDQALDSFGKLSNEPGADVDKINAQVSSLDEAGTLAYGQAWVKVKQDFRDKTWYDRLNAMALGVRDDLQGVNALQKEISEGQYSAKLDPEKKNTLVARLDGYRNAIAQRQEIAAQRADRESERRLRKAEAAFSTFQALADKGTVLAPDYIDSAIRDTAGTPYQKGITELARIARESGGLAAKPIGQQQATLKQIDQQIAINGRTPALDKRREQIAKVLTASQDDLKNNGLRAGLERGVITELAPLDTSSPEALARSVGERLHQAETVGLWAGKHVSPLDSDEATALRSMLDALPPTVKSAAVATIAQSLGPAYSAALAQQIDHQDKALGLSFALAGSKTSQGRYTSELLLKGATAIRDKAVMQDEKKVTGWKSTIAQQIDGALPDERAANAVKDAAYYIAAGIAHENGGTASTDDIERAVRLAIGGNVIERKGKKLPIPAGMDDGEFEERLRNIPASSIARQAPDGRVRVAGADMPTDAFAASIPGQDLIYAGTGRYAVVVRGRPVTNSAGQPIIVEVR